MTMLAMIAHLFIAYNYLFGSANAALQHITTNAQLNCYPQHTGVNGGVNGWATMNEHRHELALDVCDFDPVVNTNPVEHSFTIGNYSGNDSGDARVGLTIEFDETTTRNYSSKPFVIEGHGIVQSNAFKGYHARELFYSYNSSLTLECDANGRYRQSVTGRSYLAVFDHDLLREETKKEILSVFTFTANDGEIDASELYYTILNSTGLVCYGEFTSRYATWLDV